MHFATLRKIAAHTNLDPGRVPSTCCFHLDSKNWYLVVISPMLRCAHAGGGLV